MDDYPISQSKINYIKQQPYPSLTVYIMIRMFYTDRETTFP